VRGAVATRTGADGKPRYYVVVDETAADGKRRRRWHTDPATGQAFTRKRPAEDYAAKLATAQTSGTYVSPTDDTLAGWLAIWLATAQHRLKPSTYASYEKNIRLHVIPHLGAVRLQRLTGAHLDKLYAQLLTSGRVGTSGKAKGAGLSPRTVRYVHTILKAALGDAVRKGLLTVNPANVADAPTQVGGPPELTTWTPEQLSTFLAGTREHAFGPVWTFLALTGCRRGEALGLRWRDVDLDRGRASLVQSIGRVRGQVIVGSTKSGRPRSIALDPGLVHLLRDQAARQKTERELMGAGYADQGLVFAAPDGGCLYPEGVWRVFVAQAEHLGLPRIRVHDLRHTWATMALTAGVHPKIVQERLGHSSISITLQVYSHVTPVMHAEAAATVADMVAAAGRGGKVRSIGSAKGRAS